MNLKELRISKKLTQPEASEICRIPLRSYKRMENDFSYVGSDKYKAAYQHLESYVQKNNVNKSFNILVIGAGYVGLSIATLLSLNHQVDIIDINQEKVKKINDRQTPFKDKELEKYFKEKSLTLKAYLPNPSLYQNRDYILIAIPTDYDEKTGLLKTENISSLVKEIRNVNKKVMIVIKSTCYVGFTESLNDKNVIYSPEFLREGRAILDNLYPSRIIIGGDKKDKRVKEFGDLMRDVSFNHAKTLYMGYKEAESVKLFSNAYLAMRVAFFNELDSFMVNKGINSKDVVEGVSLDNRIGDYYNNPSFGYGGYCLPKDTLSLISQMDELDNNCLISSINNSNKSRKEYIVEDIIQHLKGNRVGVYSLESKKNSDNIRYSAIIDVIKGLQEKGVQIYLYSKDKTPGYETISDLESFKKEVDLIITNRYDSSLDDVKEKVYTRDIMMRD